MSANQYAQVDTLNLLRIEGDEKVVVNGRNQIAKVFG